MTKILIVGDGACEPLDALIKHVSLALEIPIHMLTAEPVPEEPTRLTVSYNGEAFILGPDISEPIFGIEDLGQTLTEVDVSHLVEPLVLKPRPVDDFHAHILDAVVRIRAEQPELDALGPFTRPPVPRYTPNHRKRNKRGKFKRTGK